MKELNDINKFGQLTLTGKKKKIKYKNQNFNLLEAKCSCGKIGYFFKCNLINGKTKTCGCSIKKYKFKNKFLTTGEISKIIGVSYQAIEKRIRKKQNLELKKNFRMPFYRENSIAGLGRIVGKSREMCRQLLKNGLTRQQIIEKYNNKTIC